MKLNDWVLKRHSKIKESPLYYKISLLTLVFLVFIGIFNSILCNEKPLVAKTEQGRYVFPAFRDFKSDLGFINARVPETKYVFAIYPPIRYSFDYINADQLGIHPPLFAKGKSSRWHTNWLGTDELGRDVVASLARGVYHSVKIALIASLLSIIIGSFYGMVIGFYGNINLKVNLFQLLTQLVSIFFILFYWYFGEYFWSFTTFILGVLLHILLGRIPIKLLFIPVDSIGVSIISLRKSIPTLILIFALLPLFRKPSQINTIIILSLIGWTGIAWIIRLQTIDVLTNEYFKTIKSLGAGFWRILTYHIYPNIKHIIFLLLIFQLAAMITMEAGLSYLGVGIAPEEVSLGTLLRQAKDNLSAWWLGLFPGLLICIMLLCLHLVYQYHQEEMEGDSKKNR